MNFDLESIRARLNMLGCSTYNDLAISFAIDKVTNLIKNNCNIAEVPEGLYEQAIDMACGEYLLMLKATGQSIGTIIDNLPKAIKAVTEGDTKIDFAISDTTNQEAMFQTLINYLLNNRTNFARFRRLVW